MEATIYVAHVDGESPKVFPALFDAQKYIVNTITSNPSSYYPMIIQWSENYTEYLSEELLKSPQSELESLESYAFNNFEDLYEDDHYCYSLTPLSVDLKNYPLVSNFYFVNFLTTDAPAPKAFLSAKEAKEYVFEYFTTYKSKELEWFKDNFHDEYCDYIESFFDNALYHSTPISIHDYFIEHFDNLEFDELLFYQEIKIQP